MRPTLRRASHSTLYAAAALVLLLLLAIVVAPWINVSRFRRRIVQSISAGLGRPVHVGSVSFQLFPQPAFVLSGFSVEEDPAFGAEPVMTADTVTATLRASTLWRRRVDVAKLSFEDPSLNLVRNANGQWDFTPMLQHASTQHLTGTEAFPYVEATGARINFKFGDEKQPLSLMDADLALWKESTGQWHVRLKTQPVRTDLDASDTGELRAEAVLQYATSFDQAPITVHAEWRKAPLGGISSMLTGDDAGWRGTAYISVDVTGTLAAADVVTRAQVENFRRMEFVPTGEMDWDVRCKTHYDRAGAQFSSILCDAPLGTGDLHLTGAISLLPQSSGAPGRVVPGIQATLRQVPANFFLTLLHHLYAGIPEQASATGEMNGQINCTTAPVLRSASCAGSLHATRWTLKLPDVPRPLVFQPWDIVPASSATPPATGTVQRTLRGSTLHRPELLSAAPPALTGLALGPVHVMLGAATPLTITGVLSPQGHVLAISGPATLEMLLPVAHNLGLPAFSARVLSAHGNAQLDLTEQGSWAPVQASATAPSATPNVWTGTVQLRGAGIRLQNWPGPIELASATVQLGTQTVVWDDLRGSYLKQNFDGTFQYDTVSVTNSPPSRDFHVHMATLNTGTLQSSLLMTVSPSSRLLGLVDHWMSSGPPMPKITGQVLADRLSVGTLTVKNAVLSLQIEGQTATVSSISGHALGGTLDGSGAIDWSTGTPAYQGRLAFHQAQPNAIATLFHAHAWGHGSIDLDLDGTARGASAQELERQITANFTSNWEKGGWDAPALAKTPLAGFRQLALQGKIQDQTVQVLRGRTLSTPHAASSVTGTIKFNGAVALDLKPSMLQISGTLSRPVLHPSLRRPSGSGPQ